jgi:hypothetical protein
MSVSIAANLAGGSHSPYMRVGCYWYFASEYLSIHMPRLIVMCWWMLRLTLRRE